MKKNTLDDRDNVELFIGVEDENIIELREPEDLFNMPVFKSLPWVRRVWIRMQIAFIQTIRSL